MISWELVKSHVGHIRSWLGQFPSVIDRDVKCSRCGISKYEASMRLIRGFPSDWDDINSPWHCHPADGPCGDYPNWWREHLESETEKK